MELSDNLKKNNILLKTRATNRWELIGEMIDLAVKNREIEPADSDEVKKSLIEREKSMSTGIGNGVAIPHCTTMKVMDLVLIMAIVPRGMDFGSIDDQLSKIIILLLVPKNKLTQHIKTLANIAKLMSNQNLRDELLAMKTPEGIIKTIKDFDGAKK
jgi:fructose-specific phosphotransferase system IIA component